MRKSDKILVICDAPGATALDQDFQEELKTKEWQTEADVMDALRSLTCSAELLGIYDDTDLIRQKIQTYQPDLVFNLVEQFKNNSAFDQNIVSFLELQGIPFTGCDSTGLTLCKHKGISKKILSYHYIRVPAFAILPRSKPIARPKQLRFPIFIKPLKEEASYGIAQASFVETDEQFKQRAQFIHEKFDQDAIAEEYIEGREIYVSVLGNHRLQVLPIRELIFKEVPPDEPKFASFKAKWDDDYRKRWGIESGFASNLDPGLVRYIEKVCKKIYHLLAINGYARLDFRLTPQNDLCFIEANPNPMLAAGEDFAQSAKKANIPYPQLIQKIIRLGKTAARG